MALLGRGRGSDARRELAALLKARPKDAQAWVCAAWVEHDARNIGPMRSATERAAKFGAPTAVVDTLRAMAANAAGDMDLAIACAQRAARSTDNAQRATALAVLAESLYYADNIDALTALLESGEDLRATPHGQLLLARVHRRHGRHADAEATLRAVCARDASPRLRRVAWSELARLLDSMQRYDDAFAAAKAMHAETGAPFDTGGLVAEVEATAQLAARGAFASLLRADAPTPPAALVCALPRSGTSLLEQMLDRHPRICGLGESRATHGLVNAFTSLGGWPQGVLCATPADLLRLQSAYIEQTRGARTLPADTVTFDKSVQVWRRLPAIAAALPGAKIIRLRRDPRDTAISLFLSPMDPRTLGWNASLADIRRVTQTERRCLPGIIAALQLDAIDMGYEDFVQHPRDHLERTLTHLGLPWHEECLAPEGNSRVVVTLSQEQVRRPLNTDGIGRWKNYAAHFDDTWAALAADPA